MKSEEMRYFRDHDDRNLIVRVWNDGDGKRRGEMWYLGKCDDWIEADDVAWMVADEIYERISMLEKEVKDLIGEKDK